MGAKYIYKKKEIKIRKWNNTYNIYYNCIITFYNGIRYLLYNFIYKYREKLYSFSGKKR